VPSSFSHAIAGVAIATPFRLRVAYARFWVFAILCATIQDVDYLWSWRIPRWNSMLAHRGITHSFAFAIAMAAVVAWLGFAGSYWRGFRLRLFLAFTLVGLSHGLLDSLTVHAGGIAFFAPFSAARFFFPWRPLAGPQAGWIEHVSIASRIAYAAATELVCIWLPSLLFIVLLRRADARASSSSPPANGA
jgi:inner membrane protein